MPDHDYDSNGKHNNEVIKCDKERRSKIKNKKIKKIIRVFRVPNKCYVTII